MNKRDEEFEKEEARKLEIRYNEASGINQNPSWELDLLIFIALVVVVIIGFASSGDDTQDGAGNKATATQTTQK